MNVIVLAILGLSALLVLVSAILTTYRLCRGPSLADQVVALDLITLLTLCGIAIGAVVTREALLLDAALAIALISFLGTVALARYVERRRGSEDDVGSEEMAPPAPPQEEAAP